MEKYDLSVHQGETFLQTLIFKNADGSLIDLSGSSGSCQIRPEPGSGDLIETVEVTLTADEGKVLLSLSASRTAAIDAGCYAYDFAMERAGSVRYYIGGKFIVLPSVTVIE